jgi:hypothetical protein
MNKTVLDCLWVVPWTGPERGASARRLNAQPIDATHAIRARLKSRVARLVQFDLPK